MAFAIPSFTPQIGRFRLDGHVLVRAGVIELKDAAGAKLSGLPNPPGHGGTGEVPVTPSGEVLPFDPSERSHRVAGPREDS